MEEQKRVKQAKDRLLTAHYDSPVGRLLLAEREGALAGLWIERQKYFPVFPQGETEENEDSSVLRQTKEWLDRYFRGERPLNHELPLAPAGSAFRQEVWKYLCQIPYGEVETYGDIARKIAVSRGLERMSAQAVGGAVGHNPISIIIPCHRVVGTGGSLTGYAGGVQKKAWLLTLEGVDVEKLSVPQKGTAL